MSQAKSRCSGCLRNSSCLNMIQSRFNLCVFSVMSEHDSVKLVVSGEVVCFVETFSLLASWVHAVKHMS